MQRKSSDSVRVFYPKFDKREVIEAIDKKLEDLQKKLPLMLVVLFGSYAKRNYTVASDVDLLVVYKGRERKEAYAVVKRTVDVFGLEPHVYSQAHYQQMKSTIDKMIKGGMVLFQNDRK
ncbi:hypothetical protein ES703_90524 [subsurface metagenome]